MACITSLRTDHLTGANTGGTWSYDGYSTVVGGPFGGGGTTPPALTGDNPSLNWDGYITGYYAFTYTGGSGSCQDTQQIVVAVINEPDAGVDATQVNCTDDTNIVDLFSVLGGSPQTGGTWSVAAGSDTPPGGSFNAGAGTFDLSQVTTAGTFIFTYTVSPDTPAGYSLSSCTDCNTSTADVTIDVLTSFEAGTHVPLAVCN